MVEPNRVSPTYIKIEQEEYGDVLKAFFYCKTKIDGKWKWTGSKIEVKKRTPSEKRELARYLFSEKGVTTKAISIMLGFKGRIRQINNYVKDLRKGNCKCDLKIKSKTKKNDNKIRLI